MKRQGKVAKTADHLLTTSLKTNKHSNTAIEVNPPCHKVILLSFDALSAEDWTALKQHPNFNKLISQGGYSKDVRSVYPSLTYPAHATVLTGKIPRKHGIISNTKLQPMRTKPDWYWFYKEIHGKTLYSEAKKKNLNVASILWPVSGNAPISYNMPEIFSNRPWNNQVSVSLMSGSKRYQIQMNERHGKIRKGLKQPQLDQYAHICALDTLTTYQPDLLMVHYTDVDTQKHNHGVSSPEVKEAIKRLDQRIGDYFKVMKQLGKEDEFSLIIFGDHGSKDVHTAIRPNVILQKEGFLSVEENGKLHHCDYIFKTCDGCAYLYHKHLNKVSRELVANEVDIIYTALEKHNADIKGIKRIITGAEAGYEGADAHALLMIEAEEGYYFLEDYEGEVAQNVPSELIGTEHWLKATHGYHPDSRNYLSVFFAYGAQLPKGDLGSINLTDIGPSVAKILGFSLGETDGKVIWK